MNAQTLRKPRITLVPDPAEALPRITQVRAALTDTPQTAIAIARKVNMTTSATSQILQRLTINGCALRCNGIHPASGPTRYMRNPEPNPRGQMPRNDDSAAQASLYHRDRLRAALDQIDADPSRITWRKLHYLAEAAQHLEVLTQ